MGDPSELGRERNVKSQTDEIKMFFLAIFQGFLSFESFRSFVGENSKELSRKMHLYLASLSQIKEKKICFS